MPDEIYKGREYQRGWMSPADIEWLRPLENRWSEIYDKFVKDAEELIQDAGGKAHLQIKSRILNGTYKDLIIHLSPDGTIPIS